MYSFSQKSLDNMQGIDSRLIRLAQEAIKITKVDFGIPSTGGRRTAQQQAELYDQDLSNADGIYKMSKHQTGKALDFYAYVDDAASWEKEHLAQVACAFLQAANKLNISIRWGGLFKNFTDMPHIELFGD